MTPNQMLSMVRKLINDEQATGFTEGGNLEEPEGTQELLTYLDRAVEEYSKRQAISGDMRLLKSLTVRNGARLPSDYIMMCGSVPVSVSGGKMTFYGDEDVMPVRYFSRLPYVSSYVEDREIPYERDQETAICAMAAIYALNKNEYNVSQDLMLLGYGVSNGNAEQ